MSEPSGPPDSSIEDVIADTVVEQVQASGKTLPTTITVSSDELCLVVGLLDRAETDTGYARRGLICEAKERVTAMLHASLS